MSSEIQKYVVIDHVFYFCNDDTTYVAIDAHGMLQQFTRKPNVIMTDSPRPRKPYDWSPDHKLPVQYLDQHGFDRAVKVKCGHDWTKTLQTVHMKPKRKINFQHCDAISG